MSPSLLTSESLGSSRVTQPVSGLRLPWDCSKQQECPDECIREGSETRPTFSFFFFFSDRPFRGQFSQDDPIIILQRRLPSPNPIGGLSEGKRKRKRKGKGEKNLVIHPWRLDNNKIRNKVK